jgi:flagellar hook-length control protein FliK
MAAAERAPSGAEAGKASAAFKSESLSRSAQSVGLSAQQVVQDSAKASSFGAGPDSQTGATSATGWVRDADSAPIPAAWAGLGLQAPEFKLATPQVQAAVPTPVQSPEFAAALAAQVTVFAKDGTQTAQLHLNPAEMGPISIQIEIQGQQAKVEFGAESVLTRGIIEQGLPALAAALSEAGLTLSGGGVSQQAQQQSQQPPSRQEQSDDRDSGRSRASRVSERSGLEPETSSASRQAPRRAQASGLDVFA